MNFRVAVVVFPEVEVLDFAGPFEVFTTASRVHGRSHPEGGSPFSTFTVAATAAAVRARAGLVTLPDHTFDSAPTPDVLLVPGGVVDQVLRDPVALGWIRRAAQTARVTASVCTGSFILAEAGLLNGKAATTHWEDLDDLRRQFPDVVVREGVRWVDEGSVVTSAGIAAGIDMSLHLVARFAGRELARATARQLDVPYREAP